MTRISFLIFLGLLCFPQLLAQGARFFPQIGDGTFQSIKFQTSVIFVNTGAAADVTMECFDSNGQPLVLTLQTADSQLGPDSHFTFSLGAGESFSAQTPGTGPLLVGYCRLTAPESVGGTAVFTRSDADSGVTLYEAGVPASPTLTNFSLFVDSLGNKDTGLALLSPPADNQIAADTDLTLTLYDKFFNLVATTDVPLSAGQHQARFIAQIFSDAAQQAQEMEGVVTVESSQPVAVVTLRQTDDPSQEFPSDVPILTTFPVVPGVAMSVASRGSFSVQSPEQIRVTLQLEAESRVRIGVIYRLYSDGELVGEHVRSLAASEQSVHQLPASAGAGRVDRLEAQLIYAGGEMGPRFDLHR